MIIYMQAIMPRRAEHIMPAPSTFIVLDMSDVDSHYWRHFAGVKKDARHRRQAISTNTHHHRDGRAATGPPADITRDSGAREQRRRARRR